MDNLSSGMYPVPGAGGGNLENESGIFFDNYEMASF